MSDYIVSDFMSTTVLTIRRDVKMREAAIIVVENSVSGMPVVDEQNKLVGILSEKDILRYLKREREGKERKGLVTDFMSDAVWVLDPETDLLEAAGILVDTNFGRLPVVKDGTLIGQIGIRDCIAGLNK